MTNNKKKAASGGLIAAAALTAVIMQNTSIVTFEMPYSITSVNEYVNQMSVEIPDEAKVDIIKLMVNGQEVDKTCLPQNTFVSSPIVFKGVDNLEIKMYRRGKEVGTVKYDKDKFVGKVKKGGKLK